jgi:hypothetical protein
LEDSTTAKQRQRSRGEEGRAAVFGFLRLRNLAETMISGKL